MVRRPGLVVNADDWGRDSTTTNTIRECIAAGAVSSVSAMVFMDDSERAAAIARAQEIEAGIHLNFTSPFCGRQAGPALRERQRRLGDYLRRRRLAQVMFHPGLIGAFEYVVAAQEDEFQRLYGRRPERYDGHHHMHLCANVLLARLIPPGAVVRRHFTFEPGEKSFGNRLYRRFVDRRLARRYQVADFMFSIPADAVEEWLRRVSALAGTAVVEIEAHPANPAEHRLLLRWRTSGAVHPVRPSAVFGNVAIGRSPTWSPDLLERT